MALTHPQLSRMLAGQGQILYPRLKPLLDEQFGNYSSKRGPNGEESDIERLLREDAAQQAEFKRTGKVRRTFEQQERDRAYRILFGWYLPPEAARTSAGAQVIDSLPAATAAAILDAARAGRIPMDIYRQDVKPIEPNLQATANQGP